MPQPSLSKTSQLPPTQLEPTLFRSLHQGKSFGPDPAPSRRPSLASPDHTDTPFPNGWQDSCGYRAFRNVRAFPSPLSVLGEQELAKNLPRDPPVQPEPPQVTWNRISCHTTAELRPCSVSPAPSLHPASQQQS
jgi:hypothetical protein